MKLSRFSQVQSERERTLVIAACSSGVDRHLDITFRLQVVVSSSLVSVLFREAFSRPYISFFHLHLFYPTHPLRT